MKFKNISIIGYSGLVGNNFVKQLKNKKLKTDLFNSKNISKLKKNKNYDLTFCAALPAEKWYANKLNIF